ASKLPRPPVPISPTVTAELACDPRTDCGWTIIQPATAEADCTKWRREGWRAVKFMGISCGCSLSRTVGRARGPPAQAEDRPTSLPQTFHQVQIRKLLLIGIRVGLAVGRDLDRGNADNSGTVGREQLAPRLLVATLDIQGVDLDRHLPVAYVQSPAIGGPLQRHLAGPHLRTRTRLASFDREEQDLRAGTNGGDQLSIRRQYAVIEAFWANGNSLSRGQVLPIEAGAMTGLDATDEEALPIREPASRDVLEAIVWQHFRFARSGR